MYHPPRGGVRGGADQFKWEDVKSDKHRENYLGHSVKAPVGRWQKGKDLLWYSKERSSNKGSLNKSEALEIAAIKQEEEEAMLAALGHKVVRKETQPLTKEEMTEVLKRNPAGRDAMNVERIGGVGVASTRAAMFIHSGSQKKNTADGISSVTPPYSARSSNTFSDSNRQTRSKERKVLSKKHKKRKRHKKKKKHRQESLGSDATDGESDKSSNKKAGTAKHSDEEASRSGLPDYGSEFTGEFSPKHHRSSVELCKNARLQKVENEHDSSSECESDLEICSTNVHYSKRRHDSTSSSD